LEEVWWIDQEVWHDFNTIGGLNKLAYSSSS
jgi:hypothetical protein